MLLRHLHTVNRSNRKVYRFNLGLHNSSHHFNFNLRFKKTEFRYYKSYERYRQCDLLKSPPVPPQTFTTRPLSFVRPQGRDSMYRDLLLNIHLNPILLRY